MIHLAQTIPMAFSFESVGDFLNKAASAKRHERQAVQDGLEPYLDDPHVMAVPPALLDTIEALYIQHGDETFKQIALFCTGRWLQVHQDTLEQHVENEGMPEALLTVQDLTKIGIAFSLMQDVGSFGGDDSWRKMIKEAVGQLVLEGIEEKGLTADQWFKSMGHS